MKNYIILLSFFLLLLPFAAANGQVASVLEKIDKEDGLHRTQVILRFNKIPLHSVVQNSRRIDIHCNDTVALEDLALFPADDRIIKILKKQNKEKLTLSLFFRYPVQEFTVQPDRAASTIAIDFLLGNPYSQQYPDLAARLKGVTLEEQESVDYTNPLRLSLYRGKWADFFEQYETDISIKPEPTLTLPPFPLLTAIPSTQPPEQWLTDKTLAAADQEDWGLVQSHIRQQLETEKGKENAPELLLAYAEAMVRDHQYAEPFKLLQVISHTYPDTPYSYLADFLFLCVQAEFEDPYLALIKLREFEKKTALPHAMKPFFNILLSEIALETNQLKKADEFLKRDDVAYAGPAQQLHLIRQADLRYLEDKQISALVSYLQLPAEARKTLQHLPMSLAFFCDTLYTYKRFDDAEKNYAQLATLMTGKKQQDLAWFRLAMSHLRSLKPDKVMASLAQIQDSFPGAEGSYRAQLKLTDLNYISHQISAVDAIEEYGRLAVIANKEPLREEARFKQALVYYLRNDHVQSIELAMQLLREFRNGNLTVEARALILEQLPLAIRDLIAKKNYVDALVLAKENRFFFQKGWLDSSILYDLALSYTKIGAYNRSAQVFRYILDVFPDEEHEEIYLPLIKTLYGDGHYQQVEKYAEQYTKSYPNGADSSEIFRYRLKALNDSGKVKEAAALLAGNKDNPDSPAQDIVAAQIYFEQHQYDKVIALLKPLQDKNLLSSPEGRFRLAESYYQQGKDQQAEPLFNLLETDKQFGDQALFRMAKIRQKQGDREKALNLFKKIAEKGKNPLWVRLANEEIDIINIMSKK